MESLALKFVSKDKDEPQKGRFSMLYDLASNRQPSTRRTEAKEEPDSSNRANMKSDRVSDLFAFSHGLENSVVSKTSEFVNIDLINNEQHQQQKVVMPKLGDSFTSQGQEVTTSHTGYDYLKSGTVKSWENYESRNGMSNSPHEIKEESYTNEETKGRKQNQAGYSRETFGVMKNSATADQKMSIQNKWSLSKNYEEDEEVMEETLFGTIKDFQTIYGDDRAVTYLQTDENGPGGRIPTEFEGTERSLFRRCEKDDCRIF